jgi:hypothetical protein
MVADNERDQPDEPSEHRRLPPGTGDQGPKTNLFCREGDYWSIAFAGHTLRLKDSKGLHYLSHLLRHPGQEFHALDLVQGGGLPHQERRTRDHGPATTDHPLLDRQAKAAYTRRLADLRDELREAEEFNDLGRAAKARAELEFITRQLSAAVGLGLGGRNRKTGAAAERARLLVTQRIKAALKKIGEHHPTLSRHLRTSVRTGYFCSYTPDQQPPVRWLLAGEPVDPR